jgi:hypothetical protein
MADKPKHPAAVALGKLNKGVPKRITDKERAARVERMANARSKRHPLKRPVPNAPADLPDGEPGKVRRDVGFKPGLKS